MASSTASTAVLTRWYAWWRRPQWRFARHQRRRGSSRWHHLHLRCRITAPLFPPLRGGHHLRRAPYALAYSTGSDLRSSKAVTSLRYSSHSWRLLRRK